VSYTEEVVDGEKVWGFAGKNENQSKIGKSFLTNIQYIGQNILLPESGAAQFHLGGGAPHKPSNPRSQPYLFFF
jgi:hypothetical protein